MKEKLLEFKALAALQKLKGLGLLKVASRYRERGHLLPKSPTSKGKRQKGLSRCNIVCNADKDFSRPPTLWCSICLSKLSKAALSPPAVPLGKGPRGLFGTRPGWTVNFIQVGFSLDPSYRRGRVYKLKFCVFLSVIASTFPL